MAIYYDNLYLKRGVRKASHFIEPPIIKADTFVFPLNSAFFWFNVNALNTPITTKYPLLSKVENNIVYTIMDYDAKQMDGKFKKIPGNDTMSIKELANKDRKLTFMRPGQDKHITDKVLKIYNYGTLTSRHQYPSQMLRPVAMFNNALRTLITHMLAEKERNIFVNIDIPQELPSRMLLDKYATKLLNSQLNNLPTYKHLLVLEIWKLINPSLRDTSIFNLIPEDKFKNINFLITIDNKTVLLNLAKLMGLVEEYKLPSEIRSIKASTVAKVFYIFLYRIINEGYQSDKELDNKSEGIIKGITGEIELTERKSGGNVVNVNDILKDEVIENNEEAERDDVTDDEDEGMNKGDIQLASEEDEDLTGVKDIEDIKNRKYTYNRVNKSIDNLNKNKVLTNKQARDLKEKIEAQQDIKDPYGSKEKLKDILDNSKDDISLTDTETTPNAVLFDSRLNRNTLKVLKEKYMSTQYRKDIIRVVYSIQNSNNIIEDYTIEEQANILGEIEKHNITIKSIKGRSSKVVINIPKIHPDGSYKLKGQKYILRMFRSEKPISKIDPRTVMLATYYGKQTIAKANYKKDDLGYAIMKALVAKQEVDKNLSFLILVPPENKDIKLPNLYNIIARYVKSFRYNNIIFTFDHAERKNIFGKMTDEDLIRIEDKGKYVVVGNNHGTPLLMGYDNKLYRYRNNKYEEEQDIYDLIGLRGFEGPTEFAYVRLYSSYIPLIVVLSYYLGLTRLLTLLKSRYRIENSNRLKPENNEMAFKFKDCILYVERDHGRNDIIIGGLAGMANIIKEIPIKIMNSKSNFSVLFSKLGMPVNQITEIKLMEDLYVDPINAEYLEKAGEPSTYQGLLIRACELLTDDNYVNPRDIKGHAIKGYERIPGMMYHQLVQSIRENENRSIFAKSKLSVNPNTIIDILQEDNANCTIDDLNPMANIKQNEDVTFLGFQGRQKEGMARDTRRRDTSEIGVISEAARDSGDVGISNYLVADPSLTDIRGNVEAIPDKDNSWSQLISTSAMLAPFLLGDDAARMNFNSIMASHIVPIANMKAPYVRTGYETMIALKAGDKFAICAIEDGTVLEVTDKSITVEYKTKGKKTYLMNSWTSKEESGGCYTHHMTTVFKPKEKFLKDDTLVYDSAFFEPDIFNKRRVLYKQGDIITIALSEDTETFEDSASISKEMYNRLATIVTKVKSIVIPCNTNIANMVTVGKKVTPNDILFDMVDSTINLDGLDEEALAVLHDIKHGSPKAKVKGVISKVTAYYNCELEECSESLKELLKHTDKDLVKEEGYPGKVTSDYKIEGKPLQEGYVQIKIYIDVTEGMGIGDKAIFGNQMKFTVGKIFDKITAEDGTVIDATFRTEGFIHRIVTSPDLIGTTSEILDRLGKKAVEMYFGK